MKYLWLTLPVAMLWIGAWVAEFVLVENWVDLWYSLPLLITAICIYGLSISFALHMSKIKH